MKHLDPLQSDEKQEMAEYITEGFSELWASGARFTDRTARGTAYGQIFNLIREKIADSSTYEELEGKLAEIADFIHAQSTEGSEMSMVADTLVETCRVKLCDLRGLEKEAIFGSKEAGNTDAEQHADVIDLAERRRRRLH